MVEASLTRAHLDRNAQAAKKQVARPSALPRRLDSVALPQGTVDVKKRKRCASMVVVQDRMAKVPNFDPESSMLGSDGNIVLNVTALRCELANKHKGNHRCDGIMWTGNQLPIDFDDEYRRLLELCDPSS